MEVMRRRIGEWLMSAGAIALLLLALLVIYSPAREDARRVMSEPSAGLTSAAYSARSYSRSAAALVQETYRTNSELVIFGIAAVVLLGFLLKT
jgi:hypothetical protein